MICVFLTYSQVGGDFPIELDEAPFGGSLHLTRPLRQHKCESELDLSMQENTTSQSPLLRCTLAQRHLSQGKAIHLLLKNFKQ